MNRPVAEAVRDRLFPYVLLASSLFIWTVYAAGVEIYRGPRVVVERVTSEWPGESAGLRPGDGVEGWSRPGGAGALESPFDLGRAEIEQGWRGPTRLSIIRTSEPLTIVLNSRPWAFSTRPALEGELLTTYDRGRRLFERHAYTTAATAWRSAAATLRLEGQELCALWMDLQAAEAASHSSHRAESHESFERAIRQSDELGGWWPRVCLRLAYASALRREGDFIGSSREARSARDVALEHSPDSLAIVSAEMLLGELEAARGDADAARNAFGRALTMAQRLAPDSLVVSDCLAALGRSAGDTSSTADFLERALVIRERADLRDLETARLASDLGSAKFQQGDIQEAERLHRRSYDLRKRAGTRNLDLADSLHWMGNVAWMKGHLAAAEDYYRQALIIRQRLAPHSRDLARTLNALGNLEGARKDPENAARFHREALAIAEQNSPEDVADLLQNLGEDQRLMGRFANAQSLLERALATHRRMPPGGPRDSAIATNLVTLAAVARDRGDLSQAERLERRALVIRELQESDTLQLAEDREVLGDILLKRGSLAEARATYEDVYRAASRLAPGSETQARAIHALGRIEARESHLFAASEDYRLALDVLEAREERLGNAPEHRESFFAAYSDFYRDSVDALVRLGRLDNALVVAERSRGRLLRELMAERDLTISGEVPPELDLERKRLDSEYERAQTQLLEAKSSEAAPQLEQLAEIRRSQRSIADQIARKSARNTLLRPAALHFAEIRDALDPGTTLLVYSVGIDRSLLFVVEARPTTETAPSVYDLPVGEKALRKSVARLRNLLTLKASAAVRKEARNLYDLLVKPAERQALRSQRLLILPDGPLHTLPWGALEADDRRYLVESKPIHVGISVSVYDELREARKHSNANANIQLTAFGDPRYTNSPDNKPAVRRGGGKSDAAVPPGDPLADEFAELEDPQLRAVARGGYRLQPLPASRKEVEEIAALYAPKSVAYLGADATEEKAKSIGRDVPLIHFATHAIINERFPLDSALVFTIPEHPKEGQDNGLLQAWEIFEQMRIDADLVTLSACDSGLGKEMGGEGLIGLTRAFQYAGARSVLASLWKVEDKATAELMKHFYTYLKSGMTKDEALRHAQIDLIHSTAYSNPRDWAAFQLNGDWK
ncbi:MAG TPA: CHAT domain-containing tetratricopeptide repeat protein [Thermoanaerobaculia bacterium]|nr:CHAT domain-containing tetratricopeptide repeat protein [Thermoanaerobaculia bacterium]